MIKVTLEGDFIVFTIPKYLNHLAKSCGARFSAKDQKWKVKATKITASAVLSNFQPNEYDPAIADICNVNVKLPPFSGMDPNATLKPPITLKPRQLEGIEKAWPKPGFAFFWCMGAGKTLSTMALANMRYCHGLIDRQVVVCPTSIIGVWVKEYDRYSAIPNHVQAIISGKSLKPWNNNCKKVLIVGTEALSQGGAYDTVLEFIKGGKCFTIIDESSLIKNHDAIRTDRCISFGEHSDFRLILTGTNVTQGLQDLYTQMYFVDPAAIGEVSFYSFRNKYCVMGGFEGRKIAGYMNTGTLFEKIRPYCDTVKKVEGLPDRSYPPPRIVKATKDQIAACKDIIKEMKAELEGQKITTQNVLEVMLRLQQISGGHLPDGTRLSKIPKLDELLNVLNEYDGKAIIWARYLPEIATIYQALEKEYGVGSTIAIFGGVPPEDRQKLVDRFQEDPQVRFVVANQATARMGLTMTAAWLTVYYSNTFSLEDRLQSECRNYRIGQDHRVSYIDLVSDIKIDRNVIRAIAYKREIAEYASDQLSGDDLVNTNVNSLDDLL
jgi:SNF2 family DNA or RNA helicase